ncbi:MAG: hypothetical protein NTZ83_04955 [Candidatus Pacearchaeota archaeon]|nr:hypothetical protein [Candidatus Pacearchaeota archaeon]
MELRQIKEGLYSLNGKPILNNNLIIAVHPYFLEYNNLKKAEEMKEKIDRIKEFIIKYAGPKIILEEASELTKTLRKYETESDLTNLFLIKTGEGCSTPFEISYDKMLDYFQEMSGNKKIFLIGGYNWNNWWNKGCLGSLKERIKIRGLPHKVISRLTF